MNDPRNPYNKLLTVEYLSNMVNGRCVLYNNQPVEVLKKLTAASLKDNEVRDMIIMFPSLNAQVKGCLLLPLLVYLQALFEFCCFFSPCNELVG